MRPSPPRSALSWDACIRRPPAGSKSRPAFANDADFDALRLDPYLRATAAHHPDLSERLLAILAAHGRHAARPHPWRRQSQEHLVRPERAGPPRCGVRHIWRPRLRPGLLSEPSGAEKHARARSRKSARRQFQRLLPRPTWNKVTWEPPAELEARATSLLAALALARVDGKSPVEYLSEQTRERVRAAARRLVETPAATLGQFLVIWTEFSA